MPAETGGRGRRRLAATPLLFRLLAGAGLALLLALAITGLAIDRAFVGAAEDAMRERLESVVYLILSTVEVDATGRPHSPESLAEPRLNRPGSTLHGGARTPFGSWSSPSLVGVVDPPQAPLLGRNETIFNGLQEGGAWHIFALGLGWEQVDGRIIELTIWAAEDPNRLKMQLSGFRADLGRWLGLAAALIIAVQGVLLWLVLRPMRRVASEIREVEAGRRERLGGVYPPELRPLTDNLNTLLDSERDNARRHREALADLAHALKTPLAVVRARLESSAAAVPELFESLDDMDQMIRRQLERVARSTRRALPPAVPIVPVARRLAGSLQRLHVADGLSIDVQGDETLAVRIDERDLWELCGNLMDNAAKYGRGRIKVAVRGGPPGRGGDGVILDIEDDGPGFPAGQFEQLSERGRRGDERRDGQGLGLAIVRELVEVNGGRIELGSSRLGGARVRVRFPQTRYASRP